MKKLRVATSLAPTRVAHQQRALASWRGCGMDVVSINSLHEIPLLREFFPEVQFSTAPRNANEVYGKPLVFLDDVLAELAASGSSICGIINSDILLDPETDFLSLVLSESQNSLLACPRIDVNSLDSRSGERVKWGFDAFFFSRDLATIFPATDFCLGMPSWDYWLPLVAAMKDVPVKLLIGPSVYHLCHPITWRDQAAEFDRKLIRHLLELSGLGDSGLELVRLLRRNMGNLSLGFWTAVLNVYLRCQAEPLFFDGKVTPRGHSEASRERKRSFGYVVDALDYLDEERRAVQTELDLIQRSFSWRLTRPLRLAKKSIARWLNSAH